MIAPTDPARRDRVFDALLVVLIVSAALTILFVLGSGLYPECPKRWEVCVLESNVLNGLLQWSGTAITLGGFGVAWLELRAVRTSSEAAQEALRDARQRFMMESRVATIDGALTLAKRAADANSRGDPRQFGAFVTLLRETLITLSNIDHGRVEYEPISSKLSAYEVFAQSGGLPSDAAVALGEMLRGLDKRRNDLIFEMRERRWL